MNEPAVLHDSYSEQAREQRTTSYPSTYLQIGHSQAQRADASVLLGEGPAQRHEQIVPGALPLPLLLRCVLLCRQ